MGGKRDIVVAIKKIEGDRVSQGRQLGESGFRKPEFALHALPQLANQYRINPVCLGVFQGGQLVEQGQMQAG